MPAHTAMHHELGLAGPFPIGMQTGETYSTKAVGDGCENAAVSLKSFCSFRVTTCQCEIKGCLVSNNFIVHRPASHFFLFGGCFGLHCAPQYHLPFILCLVSTALLSRWRCWPQPAQVGYSHETHRGCLFFESERLKSAPGFNSWHSVHLRALYLRH